MKNEKLKRNWPELHRQVVFGTSDGRIIWQPRIGCWVTDKVFAGEAFPAPFTGMDIFELYRELDCSARLYEYNACFRRIEHPAVLPDGAHSTRPTPRPRSTRRWATKCPCSAERRATGT